jgi:hypothetical protein
MFRRIEFILPGGNLDGEPYPPERGGLMSVVTGAVPEAWWESGDLLGPARSSLPPNCRSTSPSEAGGKLGGRLSQLLSTTARNIA